MKDRLLRGVFPESSIRFSVVQTTRLCGEALKRHRPDWVSAWLLSEALTCATLVSVGLKREERLALRWIYDGPIGTILADIDEQSRVRGFSQRVRLMPEVTNLQEAVGETGRISAVSSFPNRVSQTGITEAVFMDPAKDLAHFFSLSFQIETGLVVGLIVPPEEPMHLKAAAGLMIQPLPGCNLDFFNSVRGRMESPAFREWLEATAREAEQIAGQLGLKDAPQFLGECEPVYMCQCNRVKVESVLRMMEREELNDMLEKDGCAEINCHFCAEAYHFSGADLQAIIEQCQVGHA